VQHLHVRQTSHALGDGPFDQRPACRNEIQRTVIAALPHVEVKPLHVAAHVNLRGTGREQFLANAAEQPRDRILTAQQQTVRVTALRHAASMLGPFAALVALDHGDGLEIVGQHTRGQQSSHAAADNNGIAEGLALHDDPRTSG
jgi:hypothetical protein